MLYMICLWICGCFSYLIYLSIFCGIFIHHIKLYITGIYIDMLFKEKSLHEIKDQSVPKFRLYVFALSTLKMTVNY